jgi:IS30 family transposase
MGRPGLSAAQKADLWQRWKQGQSLSEIGRALGKHAGSIHGVVSSNGGFAPAIPRRSRWALTLAEREEISRGVATKRSVRQIAAQLGRAPSTVRRELIRHGGPHTYRAAEADARAWERARRPKPCRPAKHPLLQRVVARKLTLDWSPEQIAGWFKREFSDQDTMQVSHETIYRSLFIQARGVLKKELLGHLRSRRKMRRSKHASTDGQPRGQIIDAPLSLQTGGWIHENKQRGWLGAESLVGLNRNRWLFSPEYAPHSSKRSKRSYRLASKAHVQRSTPFKLQLIAFTQ